MMLSVFFSYNDQGGILQNVHLKIPVRAFEVESCCLTLLGVSVADPKDVVCLFGVALDGISFQGMGWLCFLLSACFIHENQQI